MNEKNLRRWLQQFPKIRGDLYLMLDDGWDVPTAYTPIKAGTASALWSWTRSGSPPLPARQPNA